MANSIKTWTPADYASAAGRKLGGAAPNAMDFMSRLDSNVSVCTKLPRIFYCS